MTAYEQIEKAHDNLRTSLTHAATDLVRLIFKQEHDRAVAFLNATATPVVAQSTNVPAAAAVTLQDAIKTHGTHAAPKKGSKWARAGRPTRVVKSYTQRSVTLVGRTGVESTMRKSEFLRFRPVL